MAKKTRRTAHQKQAASARRARAAARNALPEPAPGAGREPATGQRDGGREPATGQRDGGRGRRPTPRRRRRRRSSAWTGIAGVLAIVALMVLVFLTRGGSNPEGSKRASSEAIQAALSVPPSTLEKVGPPDSGWAPNVLPSGTSPVTQNGKPVVLYFGAEYCPFCAAERWPMVVALSRFGTFSDLGTTTSADAPEVFSNTPTFSFDGSTYASDHIVFSSVETATRTQAALQTPTPFQQQLFDTYNVANVTGSNGAIPFVMIGNLYTWAGTSIDPQILQGKSFDQIANSLDDPTTALARAIDGSANALTAMICRLTGDRPSSVCSAAAVRQAAAALPGS